MADDEMVPEASGSDGSPPSVLAATDQPVPIEVREIADDRVPDGMRCLGTFLDGNLVARCAVPPGSSHRPRRRIFLIRQFSACRDSARRAPALGHWPRR